MSILRLVVAAVIYVCCAPFAAAEVQSSTENGFVIVHERQVDASRSKLYELALQIERWWDPSHSYSGDATNFSLDARPGGMFVEKLPGEGFVEHMRVTMVMPGRLLRLTGGLGPLATDGLAGALTWNFADGDSENKSKIIWRYSVGGYRPEGLEELSKAVDAVLAIQIDRLVKATEDEFAAGREAEPEEVPSTSAIKPLTEHTFTLGSNFVAPEATIDQFNFIVGRWTGNAMGGWCEEVWSAPAGGEMQGMFQFVKEDELQFRELFALRKSGEDGNWKLVLKHFDATLTSWEDKDKPVAFQLLEVQPNRVVFDGLTMELADDGKLHVYVSSKSREGEASELKFEYSQD